MLQKLNLAAILTRVLTKDVLTYFFIISENMLGPDWHRSSYLLHRSPMLSLLSHGTLDLEKSIICVKKLRQTRFTLTGPSQISMR